MKTRQCPFRPRVPIRQWKRDHPRSEPPRECPRRKDEVADWKKIPNSEVGSQWRCCASHGHNGSPAAANGRSRSTALVQASKSAGAPQKRCAQPYPGVRQGEGMQAAVAFRTCHNADRAFRNWETGAEKKRKTGNAARPRVEVLFRGLVFPPSPPPKKKHSPGRRGAWYLGSPHAWNESHVTGATYLSRGRSPDCSVRGTSFPGDIIKWSPAIFEKPGTLPFCEGTWSGQRCGASCR